MGDQLTLDVIDRPAAGALRTLRAAKAAATRPGLRALIRLQTAHFRPRPWPSLTPRRVGVLAVWEGDGEVESRWQDTLQPLTTGSREHWHVRGEFVRAAFTEPWLGWQPDVTGAAELADEEPALVLISGELRARFVPAFFRDAARAVAHADGHPGYLGGLGVASSPTNTTSCSAWRSYADAKSYAYAAGHHREAMRRDVSEGHHRTEWFIRIRPLHERGTLDGRPLFAGLLAPERTETA
jgi:hypothetical protein